MQNWPQLAALPLWHHDGFAHVGWGKHHSFCLQYFRATSITNSNSQNIHKMARVCLDAVYLGQWRVCAALSGCYPFTSAGRSCVHRHAPSSHFHIQLYIHAICSAKTVIRSLSCFLMVSTICIPTFVKRVAGSQPSAHDPSTARSKCSLQEV